MKTKISEADIERYLCKKVGAVGGAAYKFTSPGRRNVPDRIVIFPNSNLIFVEVKAPDQEPTDAQIREFERLSSLNQKVTWLSSFDEVDNLVGALSI